MCSSQSNCWAVEGWGLFGEFFKYVRDSRNGLVVDADQTQKHLFFHPKFQTSDLAYTPKGKQLFEKNEFPNFVWELLQSKPHDEIDERRGAAVIVVVVVSVSVSVSVVVIVSAASFFLRSWGWERTGTHHKLSKEFQKKIRLSVEPKRPSGTPLPRGVRVPCPQPEGGGGTIPSPAGPTYRHTHPPPPGGRS